MPGDGSLLAHVLSQSNTDQWAKAGLMLRIGTNAGDPFYDVVVTPSNGIVVQFRSAVGAAAQEAAATSGAASLYLRIGRLGTTFTAFTSSDGANWTPIAGSTVKLPNLSGSLLAGMAVTSHNDGTLGLATFDTVLFSSCPGNWICQDVGGPSLAGSETVSGGTWTVQGAGNDIWGTADQFRFDAQAFPADGVFSAHVVAQINTDPWAKAGLMVRGGASAGAPFYDVFVTPGNGVAVQYRSAQGASAQEAVQIGGTAPTYLRIARVGIAFSAYTSADGVTWTLIPHSTLSLPNLSGGVLAGLAVTSHYAAALSTVSFDTISASTCSPGWTCADIGTANPAGTQTASGATWTVQGGGNDIWGTSDQFRFAWQTLAADGSVRAHVTAQTNTSTWAKAGVMLRLTADSSSPFYAVYITPANGIAVQYRSAQGANAQQAILVPGVAPIYLEVARAGSVFTTFTSADGTTWTPIAGSSVTLNNLAGALLAGLAVTAHNGGVLSTVAFDSVSVSTCPGGWMCQDVGNPALAGGQTMTGGTWTVQGTGSDIWGTSDQFHYVWQSLPSNGSVTAHVTSQTNTSPWAKAGVMLRVSADPGAPYYAVYVTPTNGIAVQYRSVQGGSALQAAHVPGTAPMFLKVTRAGTTYTAYSSSDGTNWTLLPGSTVSLPNLSGVLLAGLAITSHNSGAVCTATLNTISIG
jgi:hypothetical protein